MSGFKIESTCVGCGLCLSACSFHALELVDKKVNVNESCTLCGMCVSACPFNAIKIQADARESDLSVYKDIYVFIEYQNQISQVSYELLGKARELADAKACHVCGVLIGSGVKEHASELIAYGADQVFVYDNECFKSNPILSYTKVFEDIIKSNKPDIVLFGATGLGRSLAPRVAARVKTGLTADCTVLEIDSDGLLLQTRPAFGGNLMATITCPSHRPQMASVREGVMEKLEPDYKRRGHITYSYESLENDGCIKILEEVVSKKTENISDAEVIVAVGRGIGSDKHMKYVYKLAELLGGKVGVSRPLVDMGISPYENQIGQTGLSVAPKLLITCGISGAIQHIAGISKAETIIAINTDPKAPIFDVSDYKVVGDLLEVIKCMIAELEKR